MKIKKKRFEGKIINDIEVKTFEDEELLKLLESIELPRKEYYILGGGSLVMFRNKRYYRRFRFVRFMGIVWNIKKKI